MRFHRATSPSEYTRIVFVSFCVILCFLSLFHYVSADISTPNQHSNKVFSEDLDNDDNSDSENFILDDYFDEGPAAFEDDDDSSLRETKEDISVRLERDIDLNRDFDVRSSRNTRVSNLHSRHAQKTEHKNPIGGFEVFVHFCTS